MSSYLWYILGYSESVAPEKEVKEVKETKKEPIDEVKEHLELIKEHLLKYNDILDELRPILAKRRKALEIYFENDNQPEYQEEIHHLYTTEQSESESYDNSEEESEEDYNNVT